MVEYLHTPLSPQPSIGPFPRHPPAATRALIHLRDAQLTLQRLNGLVGATRDLNVGHPSAGHREPPVRCGHTARRLQALNMRYVLELANEANSQPLLDRGIVLRHSRRGYRSRRVLLAAS